MMVKSNAQRVFDIHGFLVKIIINIIIIGEIYQKDRSGAAGQSIDFAN